MTDIKSFTMVLPTEVKVGKHLYSVNLNTFRNLYYITKNQMKRKFMDLVIEQLPDVHFNKITIHYKVFFGDRRRHDITNIVSMVDKFLEDALVERHIIEDDDYKHVLGGSWEFGGISEPKIEVTINGQY